MFNYVISFLAVYASELLVKTECLRLSGENVMCILYGSGKEVKGEMNDVSQSLRWHWKWWARKSWSHSIDSWDNGRGGHEIVKKKMTSENAAEYVGTWHRMQRVPPKCPGSRALCHIHFSPVKKELQKATRYSLLIQSLNSKVPSVEWMIWKETILQHRKEI